MRAARPAAFPLATGDRVMAKDQSGRFAGEWVLGTVEHVGPNFVAVKLDRGGWITYARFKVLRAVCPFCDCSLLPEDDTADPSAEPFALPDFAGRLGHLNCCHRAAIDAADARHAAQ